MNRTTWAIKILSILKRKKVLYCSSLPDSNFALSKFSAFKMKLRTVVDVDIDVDVDVDDGVSAGVDGIDVTGVGGDVGRDATTVAVSTTSL